MKIDIIGSVGAGKTTLARKLSDYYRIPHYEKDDIVWVRDDSGDYKRSAEDRDALFQAILAQDNWIVEGSPRKVLQESFDKADVIIFLDVPSRVRLKRLLVRWFRQRSGKEPYHVFPDFAALGQFLRWHRQFNRDRAMLLKNLKHYGKKVQVCLSSQEALKILDKIAE
ncbi:MAG: AAA family ATPase [Streptococcus orisratti]|uniref:AAA family ATPase n=1 Tax=Streptococcus orisratti TaxID=114652 RepID=UPI002A91630D|nr:AAA family ATPase [Streptococcus orisratti]MDY5636644.1 AAA family ATPase [Streptococcus orisratti]